MPGLKQRHCGPRLFPEDSVLDNGAAANFVQTVLHSLHDIGIAFIFLKANTTIFNSSQPSRKREICVSP